MHVLSRDSMTVFFVFFLHEKKESILICLIKNCKKYYIGNSIRFTQYCVKLQLVFITCGHFFLHTDTHVKTEKQNSPHLPNREHLFDDPLVYCTD